MIPDDSLYLYNLTLKQPSLPYKSIVGQFSGTKKQQELVLVSSTVIEVYQAKPETGKLQKLSLQPTFGIVQNADELRLIGTQRDVLVITADSGNIIIASYNPDTSKFEPQIQEPHSKNGLRRLTPGEYLAVNPQNRAIMLGALERTKFVYKVEMDNESGKIRLSSPLEALSSGTLTLDLCPLDTNYENPLWAAIEVNNSEYSHKNYTPSESSLQLNYYEFDQGLNYIVQKKSKSPLPSHASSLIPLPGHIGGVLIVCDSYIIYEKGLGHQRMYLPLPIRENSDSTKICCHYLHVLKKTDFFILLQSTLGDLFKVTFDYNKETEELNGFSATYFDSIPVCNSINILKSGFMFANVANDNKLFYQFEKLGSENESTMLSSSEIPNTEQSSKFSPQGLENLALVDIHESLGPIISSEVMQKQAEGPLDTPVLLAALSSHSYLKALTYGIPVSELVSSPLPITPTLILTTKKTRTSKSDDYLVLTSSLDLQTLILSIGEVVEEVSDSGFVADQHTIAVQQVGKQSVVQIHANGIRHIRHVVDPDSGEITDKKTTDWVPPAGIRVLHASANEAQVIVGLSNRELCYFEIDPTDDQLGEYQERHEVGADLITAVAIMSDASSVKSDFAIIGCADETIQVISLHPNSVFELLTLQALSSKCTSLLMLAEENNSAQIHIGMESGVYARVQMDTITGKLRDTRLKYLGTKAVTVCKLNLPTLERSGVFAISSRPWIGFVNSGSQFKMMPLIGSNVTSGASFYSEDIGTESVVGINGNNLVIFTVGNEETGFNVNDEFSLSLIRLRFQPRKHIKDSKSNHIVILESEANTESPFKEGEEVDEDYYQAFGYKRVAGSWASCIQVVDYDNQEITQTIPFDDNECFTSICAASFNDDEYVVASSSQDLSAVPNSAKAHFIHVFKVKRLKSKAFDLQFVHKTKIDGLVSAMAGFQKRLLVGTGSSLRLFELGQKQMLRKSHTKVHYLRRSTQIKYLGGDLVIIGDSSESVSYLKFDPNLNQFVPVCNDIMRRQVTAFETVDNRTIVGGDKFGNVFLNRLPNDVASQLENNALFQINEDLDASGRFETKCEFYLADIPTSFSKGTFVVGGTESIIYTGLQGTIGLMIPLLSKLEAELLSTLQVELRSYFVTEFDDFDKTKQGFNLLGKDQGKFRSYFNPSKNVIDGDFVERFYEVPLSHKIKIAGKLGRTPREIEKKLYDIRNRSAF